MEGELRAVEVNRQACDGGDAAGCINLGRMYEEGHGVAQDQAKAVTLYRKACEMGLERACADANSKE